MLDKHINALRICDIPSHLGLENIIAFNPLNEQDVLILFSNHAAGRSLKTFTPNSNLKGTKVYSAFRTQDQDIIPLFDIANPKFDAHFIQPLPGYRFLLVNSRSSYRSSTDFDKNGWIYDGQGNLLENILLGDGIAQIRTTKSGTIWTSYFDEGVYGNLGWKQPIGYCGLRAWSVKGDTEYEFEPISGLNYICCCYAMNVTSNSTTWVYYYSDFPLVNISNGAVTDFWNIPIEGSDGFAIYKNFALFRGGYHDSDNYTLIKLMDNHKATILKKIKISNIHNPSFLTYCGPSIFLIEDNTIYLVSMRNILE